VDDVFAFVRPEAPLGDPLRHERNDDGHEDRRSDREPEVGGEIDRLVRIDDGDRLVGHFGEQTVERCQQDVHCEAGTDAGIRSGESSKRMTSHAQIRSGGKRNEDEVAGVSGDARQPADEDDDERQQLLRSNLDELANERRHQAGLLGNADADHCHEHDGDDAEASEVVHEGREDEPDAIGAQQTAYRRRLLVDFEVLLHVVVDGWHDLRDDGTVDELLLHDEGGRLDHVVGHADVERRQDRRQHDHQPDEPEENDGWVGNLVADPLDRVEDLLQTASRVLLSGRLGGCGGVSGVGH
jgi:hypothetical protein